MRHYTQLTQGQRYQIYALKQTGTKQKDIAIIVGVDKSTISRELIRNKGKKGYRPKQAHSKAIERRASKVWYRIVDPEWRLIESLIERDFSPEQISGRIKQERGISISHEWIYQHIYENKQKGGELHAHLRCRKKRRKRYGSHERRGNLLNRISIEERPRIVETKKRIGDLEGDTVIGKGYKGALITMVERKSLLTLIEPIKNRNSSNLRKKMVKRMSPYKDRIHTITVDNGKEFAEHQKIAEELGANIYFAHPYSSWERGLNENTNGLIRQYLPKKSNLSNISRQIANNIMDKLNHRPRKTLAFRTPYEVFYKTRTMLTEKVALGS